MLSNLLLKSFDNLHKWLNRELLCQISLLQLDVLSEQLDGKVKCVSKDIQELEYGANENPDYKISDSVFTVCSISCQNIDFDHDSAQISYWNQYNINANKDDNEYDCNGNEWNFTKTHVQ